jgi:hypothetical protein
MAGNMWKALIAVGVLGASGLVAGCNERQQKDLREDARQVGKEVGDAVQDVEDASREAAEGFREGLGGSGKESGGDADIGQREGVINDGEGPFEQRRQPDAPPTLLDDGRGPLEEGEHR